MIRRTVAVIRLRDRLGQCALDRTGGDGGTYYGRMTAAGTGWPMPAALIRLTVAVIRLRDRLGRCARNRTGGRRRDVLRPYDKPPGPDGPCLPP